MTSFEKWKRRHNKAQAFGGGGSGGGRGGGAVASSGASHNKSNHATLRIPVSSSTPSWTTGTSTSTSTSSARAIRGSASPWTTTTITTSGRRGGSSFVGGMAAGPTPYRHHGTAERGSTPSNHSSYWVVESDRKMSLQRQQQQRQEQQQPLVLDDDTARQLEFRVKQLLIDYHNQCRVADIVLFVLQPVADQFGQKRHPPPIASSGWTKTSHYGKGDDNDRHANRTPWSSLNHSVLLNQLLRGSSSRQRRQQDLRQRKKQALERWMVRYQWANVIQNLMEDYPIQRPSNHTPTEDAGVVILTSWKHVKELLSDYMVFPSPTTVDAMEWEHTASAKADHRDPIWEEYDKRLLETSLSSLRLDMTPSQRQWIQLEQSCAATSADDEMDPVLLQHHDQLQEMQHEYEQRHTRESVRQVEAELDEESRRDEAQKLASELMRPLTDDEQRMVQEALYGPGNDTDVVAREGSDSVQRSSMRKLQPGRWLNDEVIHFFCVMLSKRDMELCQQAQEQGLKKRRSHFFKSFFVTKLLNEGHADPAKDGEYEYKNVKRWSKNVPGKDIFELDKIVFPINVSGMHWVCAVIFMQEKKIQLYDSLGSDGLDYLEHLLQYLQDEHVDKKKAPLPDLNEWKLVPCQDDTPRQLNGYDCGVFTCMFADFVSNNCPLLFDQSHITQCRERIALSILNGRAIL